MNKITIILKESGTIAEIKKNFSIYRGSSQNILLNVLVPKSIIADKLCTQYVNAKGEISTENGIYTVVKIGEVYCKENGKLGKTESFYVRYLKDLKTCDGEYQLYERILPSSFTQVAGTGITAPELIINIENIINNVTKQEDGIKIVNEPTIISLITSQRCRLEVEQSTNLDIDPVVEPSEFDLLSGQVNNLVQEIGEKAEIKDTVLKYNLLEDLPNTVIYNKDGYKTLGVHFFNEIFNVPVSATEKKDKTGAIFVSDVRPHESELYWIYQDEVFDFDTGIVKRTLTINAVQKAIGQYTTLNVGEWQPVGNSYYKGFETELANQKQEIDSLKGRSSRYVINLGDNTSPSQDELTNAFKQASGLETPKDGTTLLDLDNNKEYTWFESSGQWFDRGASTITAFTNTSSGSIQGSDQDGYVSAENGKGKVNGWQQVKDDIGDNAKNINTKVSKNDLTKVAINKTIQYGENSVVETISYQDMRDNTVSTEQFEIEGTNNNISVTVKNNKVTLKADPDGVSKVHTISLNKEETIYPDNAKNIDLPAFVKEDLENEIEGKAGVISKEQAGQIAFKDDARVIAEEIVDEEQTRAEQAEKNLSDRIETNKNNIADNREEINNIINDYIPKANAIEMVVSSESYSVGETGTLDQTEEVFDLKTGTNTTRTKTAIPVVNGKARLFLPQDQETLQDLEQFRASMQGEALSYQTDLSGVPSGETSSAAVQAYLTAKYKDLLGKDLKPLDQTVLTDETLGVSYKWYTNDNLWYLSHGAPTAIAGNNMYGDGGVIESYGNGGIIVGSNKEGYILVETNGEAALNGYDVLKSRVGKTETDISKEIEDRQKAISDEIKRAQEAEKSNADAIANESSRAQSSEDDLSSSISGEISRAKEAEKTNADAIAEEIKRATAAEASNSGAIELERTNRETAISGLQEALDSEISNREEAITQIVNKIPNKTSQLTNDGDGTKANGETDPYAKISQIPTNNNQLENGAGYAKTTDLGKLATKDTITDDDISSISSSKINGLGSLAGKSSITNADIASNAAIDQSKINGLTSALNNKANTSAIPKFSYDAATQTLTITTT